MAFTDRVAAGRLLAEAAAHLRGADVVVLGLPRGGMPVAFEVARSLDAPLDVIVVRKVGVPWQPELAMGAVGENGACTVNEGVVRRARIDPAGLAAAQAHARVEVERRVRSLRGGRPGISLRGRTAVIVDDGVATGSTARAACQVARAHGAARIVLAVPVAPPDTVAGLSEVADEVICLHQPRWFPSVGQFYDDFTPTTDDEVVHLLREAATARTSRPAGAATEPNGRSRRDGTFGPERGRMVEQR
jgi:putative phosphoribosyl transferase